MYVKLILSELQKIFLCDYGILIRGSIVKGSIYADDEIVFGKGLIDCVNLECKTKYPRIILQDGLEDEFMNDGYILAEKGMDGKYEIIYLKPDGDDYETEIRELQRKIFIAVFNNCAYKRDDSVEVILKKEKLIEKYVWIIETFNKINFSSGYEIAYRIDISFEHNCKVLLLE